MWYNSQAVRKEGSEWSLKIEQQEISTKHCEVRNTKSRQRELYILNKVKEAKIKIARKIVTKALVLDMIENFSRV